METRCVGKLTVQCRDHIQISIELRLHISRSKKEGNLKLGKVLLIVEFSKQQILRKMKKVISQYIVFSDS